MGFYVRHLKSEQAKKFAPIIEKAFSNPTTDGTTTVSLQSKKPSACQDAISAAYAVLRDNPQIFYYNISLSCTSIGSQLTLKADLLYSIDIINRLKTKMDDEIQRIMSTIINKESLWERELAIFEYMHNSIRYLDDGTSEEGNIVGPLLLKRGVCEGISKMFAVLCHKAGIPCILVFGGNHMWNIVTVNGVSSHVDVTYGIGQPPCDYSYFNIPDDELFHDHNKDIDCIPPCISDKTDYYHMRGTYFQTEDELRRYLAKSFLSGKKTIHAKLENGDPERVLKRVSYLSPQRITYTHNKAMKTITIQKQGGFTLWKD